MAFIFADPFASYANVTDMSKGGWTSGVGSGTTWLPTGGRFGLGARRLATASPDSTQSFTAATGDIIVSFDVNIESSGVNTSDFIYFYNNSGTDLCLQIGNTPADAIRVTDANNVVVHTSPAAILTRGVWHRIEIQAQIGNSAGNVKVWVNGVEQINLVSSVDMFINSSAGCDRITWINDNTSMPWMFGSPIISDTSGAAPWNAPLGDKRLYCLLPDGDGTVPSPTWAFTGGASNFDSVNDPIPGASDADLTYVQKDTAGAANKDLYTYQDLPAGVVGIIGVIVDVEARKTDAGTLLGNFKTQIEHSTITTDSPVITLTTGYLRHRHMFPDVPGGSGWTAAEVNLARSGPFFDV